MRLAAPSAGLLLGLAASLAGCAEFELSPPGTASNGTGTPHSFIVTVTDLPTQAAPLSRFDITVTFSGDGDVPTDHIGAHFGQNSTRMPSTAAYDQSCTHTAGILPGTFRIHCAAPPQSGVYHLRGHARTVESGSSHDWWSEEHKFFVGEA